MNTTKTCSSISRLLFLTDDEMSEQEYLALSGHMESCPSCKKTHEDFLVTRRKSIQLNANFPVYPDFTILTENLVKTRPASDGLRHAIPLHPDWDQAMTWIRYVSGIAAVFLLFLFISEQTLSVSKISGLENQVQSMVIPSSPGLIDRMTLARSVFTGKEWTDLAEKLNVNQRVTDHDDFLRIKSAVEKRMHSKKTVDLAFITSIRNSPTIKRNVITINNLFK